MACERHGGSTSGIGKRQPKEKIVGFFVDPVGFWLRTTIEAERTASKGEGINSEIRCCVYQHSIGGQYFDMANVLKPLDRPNFLVKTMTD